MCHNIFFFFSFFSGHLERWKLFLACGP
jgi:hypothetical protein